MLWSDEFEGAAGTLPDVTKWSYDSGAGGWGNNELETYCAGGSDQTPCSAGHPNAYLDGSGHLVIQAIHKNGSWTSARLKTEGKFSFTYGRVEARMKLPAAHGFWPAFWMLGDDITSAGWPQCGETDIIEWVQRLGPDTTSSTTHGPGYSGSAGIGTKYTFPRGGRVDDPGYHVYGLIWSPNLLQYYRDSPGNVILRLTPESLPAGKQWVFNHPFFILLNFAVGGGYGGDTDASTPETGRMLVDYVRVYQAGTAPSN